MKEIKDAIYQRMESDATLRAVTGWSESDARVYAAYPPKSVSLSASQPVSITLALDGVGTEAGPDGATMPDEIYLIEIRGRSSGIVETAYCAVINLLKDWSIETVSYRGMQMKLLTVEDGFDKNGSAYLRKTRWLVSHILKSQ